MSPTTILAYHEADAALAALFETFADTGPWEVTAAGDVWKVWRADELDRPLELRDETRARQLGALLNYLDHLDRS